MPRKRIQDQLADSLARGLGRILQAAADAGLEQVQEVLGDASEHIVETRRRIAHPNPPSIHLVDEVTADPPRRRKRRARKRS